MTTPVHTLQMENAQMIDIATFARTIRHLSPPGVTFGIAETPPAAPARAETSPSLPPAPAAWLPAHRATTVPRSSVRLGPCPSSLSTRRSRVLKKRCIMHQVDIITIIRLSPKHADRAMTRIYKEWSAMLTSATALQHAPQIDVTLDLTALPASPTALLCDQGACPPRYLAPWSLPPACPCLGFSAQGRPGVGGSAGRRPGPLFPGCGDTDPINLVHSATHLKSLKKRRIL